MNSISNRQLSLSLEQAKKIVLLSQGIHRNNELGRGKDAVYKAIEMLSYVQIDSISVIERAHHHSLWNRVEGYHPGHIDQLLEDKCIFEYWSHAAAYLPMVDYRYSLPRKQAIAGGEKHWFDKDTKLAKKVLDRIKAEGPLQASDFEDKNHNNTGWGDWKPAKKALEQLYMEGELMVVKRQGFQKVYDLSERVLPNHIDTSTPTREEYCQYLINRYLKANGIATPEQVSYLLKGVKSEVRKQCQKMLTNGQLITVRIGEQHYFALPTVTELLEKKLSRNKVRILSPFDNLLIQRKRTKALFNYDYQIECYLPANKRKFGYFSLPLLWGQNFAGRMDVKMDRTSGILNLLHLHIETERSNDFIIALKPALDKFLAFNKGWEIDVKKITSSIVTHSKANLNELSKLLMA